MAGWLGMARAQEKQIRQNEKFGNDRFEVLNLTPFIVQGPNDFRRPSNLDPTRSK